jgi:hypothetical protein
MLELETYTILVEKPEREKSLGRYGNRWQDNITIVVEELRPNVCTELILFKTGKNGRV